MQDEKKKATANKDTRMPCIRLENVSASWKNVMNSD